MTCALLIISCKKDKNEPVDQPPIVIEQELITTFKLVLKDTLGLKPTITVYFRDLDGPGGSNPSQFDTIRLSSNTVYQATIDFFNESLIPTDTITKEIIEEAKDHLICFSPNNINLGVKRTDSDGTYELGLSSLWTIGTISTGNILIQLKHQPDIKNGICDLGETDIELNFEVIIE